MIEIKKPSKKPIVVVRAATGNEFSNYEKQKLARIADGAQVNTIEVIKINDKKLPIDSANKEVRIDLGNLAFESVVKPDDLSDGDLFFIKCELD
jgi:hypothetical protein